MGPKFIIMLVFAVHRHAALAEQLELHAARCFSVDKLPVNVFGHGHRLGAV